MLIVSHICKSYLLGQLSRCIHSPCVKPKVRLLTEIVKWWLSSNTKQLCAQSGVHTEMLMGLFKILQYTLMKFQNTSDSVNSGLRFVRYILTFILEWKIALMKQLQQSWKSYIMLWINLDASIALAGFKCIRYQHSLTI